MMLRGLHMFLLIIVTTSCSLTSTTAQGVKQVCYIGDELIRETELKQVNITENPGGLYIMTSNPALCVGIGTSIEVCVHLRSMGIYRLRASLFRNDTSGYNQIGTTQVVDITSSSLNQNYQCTRQTVPINDQWIIQKGDYIGIQLSDGCVDTYCQPQLAIVPPENATNFEVLYLSNYESRTTVSQSDLTTLRVRVNARVSVALFPPPLSDNCSSPRAVTTDYPTKQPSRTSIGRLNANVEPANVWKGGGTYILTETVQVDGIATSMDYCAYLNIEGTGRHTFILALLRRIGNGFTQVQSLEIYSDSNTMNVSLFCEQRELGWDLKTGDLFAITIFNGCRSSCPTLINFLGPDSCNPVLYFAGTFADGFTQQSLSIVQPSPNMNISIEPPYDRFNLAQSLLIIGLVVIVVLATILAVVCARLWCRSKKEKKGLLDVEMTAVHRRQPSMIQFEINARGNFRRTRRGQMSNRSHVSVATRLRTLSTPNEYEEVDQTLCQTRGYDRPSVISTQSSHSNNTYQAPNYEMEELRVWSHYERDVIDYEVPVFSPAGKEEGLKQQLMTLGIDEIPEDQLTLQEELGHGQFGTVYKALWHVTVSQDTSNPQPLAAGIAVKVMDNEMTTEDRIKFLQEAVLMGQFSDPNIVAVFGVVITPTKLMLLCELMDEDLRKHLNNIRANLQDGTDMCVNATELPALLLSYCRKIASSFVYLGLKNFVHRDLAARNILVSKEGDCKVSDFGMSHDLKESSYYKAHGGMVPVKWTAPEAILYKKYSTKSDVWSYGILLYEIWSLGYKPYQGITNMEVIAKIQTGYRLPPPPGCPRTIYDIMIKCTHPEPESRPTFTNVLVDLQRPDYQLLKWTQDDVATNSEATRTLGTPLDKGHCLYKDLQNTYTGSITNSIAI